MNLRKKYHTPLERISEVSSPDKHSSHTSQTLENDKVDPLSMGESYSSFLRIKQEKEQQQRRQNREQLRQRQEQIDRLKEEVIDIKVQIGALESRLEEYKYPPDCDCRILERLLDICAKWLRHPMLKLSRNFLFMALLQYFCLRNKKQFVYGRVLYWMLGIFQTINKPVEGAIRE